MASAALGAFLAVLLWARPALGHAGHELSAAGAWSAWHFTPDAVLATLLAGGIYLAGLRRIGQGRDTLRAWRSASFFAGLAALFLALQSPIDPIAERVFTVHQVQHLLLRMVGPMLLALAAPQACLVAGVPDLVRRRLLAPLLSSRSTRAAFGFLTDPIIATALFIAALYLWQVPGFHDLAILDDGVHYLMHVTMLASGLLFWWLVFDRRPAPMGLRYGVRLMMLWLVILSNIALGAYLSLKTTVLYRSYDVLGRLWLDPLSDERFGGATIWIPGSMMCVVAILIVVHMLGRHETAVVARAGAKPLRADDMIARQRAKNRTLAASFALFIAAVFTAALLVGLLHELSAQAGGPPPGAQHAVSRE